MKIGINLLYLLPGVVGGTETYAVCLLKALAKLEDSDEYIVFVNEESAELPLPDAPRFKRVVCPVWAKSRAARYFFEQFRLPILLKKYRVDLVHSLGYVTPLFTPCLNVVTIPDTNYYAIRENFPLVRRLVLTFFSTMSAHRADRVITISEFSKQQIHKFVGIPLEKITVTLLGPGWLEDGQLHADPPEISRRYQLPEKYLIAFGGGNRHKNIPRLLEAYTCTPDLHPFELVIIGRLPEGTVLPAQPPAGQPGPRVRCLGFVPTEDIQPLMSLAALFVLPTLYEGFGLPILEAQHAGVPVASSNAASVPEIGGDGAIYFDPSSTTAIAGAMTRLLGMDKEERSALLSAGRANLAKFSWRKTALDSRAVYAGALKPGPNGAI